MPIGHSFTWSTTGEGSRFDDPPPNTKCAYCDARFDQIVDIHHCPVMIARDARNKMGGDPRLQ